MEVRANLIPSAFLNHKNLIIYAKLAGARLICQFHQVGTKNQSTSLDSLLTFFNIKIETLLYLNVLSNRKKFRLD